MPYSPRNNLITAWVISWSCNFPFWWPEWTFFEVQGLCPTPRRRKFSHIYLQNLITRYSIESIKNFNFYKPGFSIKKITPCLNFGTPFDIDVQTTSFPLFFFISNLRFHYVNQLSKLLKIFQIKIFKFKSSIPLFTRSAKIQRSISFNFLSWNAKKSKQRLFLTLSLRAISRAKMCTVLEKGPQRNLVRKKHDKNNMLHFRRMMLDVQKLRSYLQYAGSDCISR